MPVLENDVIIRGATASIPTSTAKPAGAIYIESDLQRRMYRDSGSSWDQIGGMVGGVGAIAYLRGNDTASAAATNLAASTFNDLTESLSGTHYRQFVDLRGMSTCRIMGRIGGSLATATMIRIQYNPTSDPTVATGDGGWAELATSAGSHTLNALFLSAEITIPTAARVWPCLTRVGLYGGDGAADPTVSTALLIVYP